MSETEGFILCGGLSSRMGKDKAVLGLDGRSFVERISEALASVAARITLVSSRHSSELFGLPVIPDIYQNCGALGGLHAALSHARASHIIAVSCDLPFVTGALLLKLASFVSREHDVVVPVQDDGRLQPLCAIYTRQTCLKTSELLLRRNELRPRTLLAEVRTRLVGFDEISELDGSSSFFLNVNTPEDFERARSIIE